MNFPMPSADILVDCLNTRPPPLLLLYHYPTQRFEEIPQAVGFSLSDAVGELISQALENLRRRNIFVTVTGILWSHTPVDVPAAI